MKSRFALLLLLSSAATVMGQVSFGEPQLFNENWTFQKGDNADAAKPTFDDSNWRKLDLPHDWSVEGPLSPGLASATGYLPGGIAWYRKTFDVSAEASGKQLYLYLEGVYNYGEVFINGHSLGVRPNGYISYLVNLTPDVIFGGKNVVAVRVDHSKYADSRWYTGSGIYRDVYLVYANPVHIGQWGVFWTTPEITKKLAKALVQTTVRNSKTVPATVTVMQEVMDATGKVLARVSGKLTVNAAGSASLNQSLTISKPVLWSLDKPFRYTLKTTVLEGQQVIDATKTLVGIRSLQFDADKGFALNGERMKVKGVCMHHDAGCLGSAVPADVWRQRLVAIKSLGCNAIRTSHNPQAPILYELCDELGLLVMNEAFDEWEYAKKKWVVGWNQGTPAYDGAFSFFEQWGETDLQDMVLRDRNHPSIIMWSIGNEVDYPNDPYSHPILNKEGIQQQHTSGYLTDHPHADRLGGIAKKLAAVVRANDPSRPVTAGLAGPVMSNETEYPGVLDVVGYNYTERRYAQDHAAYPKRVFYGSENGHDYSAWKAVVDNDYIFGQFLWTGTDYLGEAFEWPSRGFTTGLLDLAGFKKPRGYFRESLWSKKPMIYIGTSFRFRNSQPSIDAVPLWNYQEGWSVCVCCYTNCEQATLLLNGEPVGEAKARDQETGIISWDIPYKPGKLEGIGLNGGQEVARFVLETSKQPAAIKATASASAICRHKGLAEVTIQLVDENGVPVYLSDNEVFCLVQGPVRLLGMEASNNTDMGDYTDNRQRVNQGRLKAYLQATGQTGKATVTFRSNWLKEAVVKLTVE